MNYRREIIPFWGGEAPDVSTKQLFERLLEMIQYTPFEVRAIVKGRLVLGCEFEIINAKLPRGQTPQNCEYSARLEITAGDLPVVGESMRAFVTRHRDRIVFKCNGRVEKIRVADGIECISIRAIVDIDKVE